ncbi:hypothetical protein H257_07006 [Aphanomyces astaci]|uniref:RNase H type-1 domain-containing protein n=1 Tax=Aphanomyces astaci TaxID=112090 RepID=W4GL65_APHAT|nr:hypothetical protein H257_07006 [Aphanomyces astaci]ETV79784.1 hypothetical protein H257_07006 [Aphanomyces astaci]|eukprot:XP_009830720.1 hypothetical protein H257_07006 [Aphanomyces astaci]
MVLMLSVSHRQYCALGHNFTGHTSSGSGSSQSQPLPQPNILTLFSKEPSSHPLNGSRDPTIGPPMAWRRTTLDTKLGSSSARSPSDTSGMTTAQFEALASYRTRRRHHLSGELYQTLILQCRRFLAAPFSPPRGPTPLHMEGMVFFDGAARLDRACGGSGALVLAREFPLLCDYDAHYLPMATTNNQAEYDGLVRGLTLARTQGYIHLTIYGDSQLLVRQMIGVYRVHHPGLRSTYLQARLLAAQLKCSRRHRPREGNQAADFLSKLAPMIEPPIPPCPDPSATPSPPAKRPHYSINVTWISIPGETLSRSTHHA